MDSRFWMSSGHRQNAYQYAENDRIEVWLSGIAALNEDGWIYDPLYIGEAALKRTLDFGKLHGFFRIVVHNKEAGGYLFFCDNQGSQRFYIDEDRQLFSDSLLFLATQRAGDKRLSFSAALQMFNDVSFSDETLIEGIYRTDPEKIYSFYSGRISMCSKQLGSFSAESGMEPKGFIDAIVSVTGEGIGAVCTGGTDSRTVIAHLDRLKIKPELVITGYRDNPDVALAREISKTIGLDLTVIDPGAKEDNWLQAAFEFTDGEYETVLSYRHLQVCRWAEAKGIRFLFGGVGGEFYKNSFYAPIRNRELPWRKTSTAEAFNKLIGRRLAAPSWTTLAMKNAEKEAKAIIEEESQRIREEGSALHVYNRVGYKMLCTKSGAITNAFAGHCTRVDPLMDRSLISHASKYGMLQLSMHMWQRRQIYRACPKLSDIATDTGYSCTVRPLPLFAERVKKGLFWLEYVLMRVKRKLGMKNKTPEFAPWKNDYSQARESEEFHDSVTVCEKLGLVLPGCADSIPDGQVGNIILIGKLFKDAKVIAD